MIIREGCRRIVKNTKKYHRLKFPKKDIPEDTFDQIEFELHLITTSSVNCKKKRQETL